MGGDFTYPKTVPLVLTHSHLARRYLAPAGRKGPETAQSFRLLKPLNLRWDDVFNQGCKR